MTTTNRVLKHKSGVTFDVTNPAHLEIYATFLTTGHWSADIKFMLEEPHQVVPTMIERKLAVHHLRERGMIAETDTIRM